MLFHWDAGTIGLHPLVEAVSQGALATGTCFAASYALGYFPELRDGLKQRISWWP